MSLFSNPYPSFPSQDTPNKRRDVFAAAPREPITLNSTKPSPITVNVVPVLQVPIVDSLTASPEIINNSSTNSPTSGEPMPATPVPNSTTSIPNDFPLAQSWPAADLPPRSKNKKLGSTRIQQTSSQSQSQSQLQEQELDVQSDNGAIETKSQQTTPKNNSTNQTPSHISTVSAPSSPSLFSLNDPTPAGATEEANLKSNPTHSESVRVWANHPLKRSPSSNGENTTARQRPTQPLYRAKSRNSSSSSITSPSSSSNNANAPNNNASNTTTTTTNITPTRPTRGPIPLIRSGSRNSQI